MNQDELQDIEQSVRSVIQSSALTSQTVEALGSQIGARPAGSEQMRKASVWLEAAFIEAGLHNVQLEPVEVAAVHSAESRVEIFADEVRLVASLPVFVGADGDATAQLCALSGDRLSSSGELSSQLRGQIALASWPSGPDTFFFLPALKKIQEADALGVILISRPSLGGGTVPLSAASNPDTAKLQIPVATVSHTSGTRLFEQLGDTDISASLAVSSDVYHGGCSNVLAELGPLDGEVIAVSAHLDTLPGIRGYFDNASGVAAMLEIASALAPYEHLFCRRLIFAAFTGEEFGFQGSAAFVRQHERDLGKFKFMFNIDSVWKNSACRIVLVLCPELQQYLHNLFESAGLRVSVSNRLCYTSDYLPFVLQGVPAGRQGDCPSSHPYVQHTLLDNHKNVTDVDVKNNAATFSSLALRMACDPNSIPSQRRTNEEVTCAFSREGLTECLKAYDLPIGAPSEGII